MDQHVGSGEQFDVPGLGAGQFARAFRQRFDLAMCRSQQRQQAVGFTKAAPLEDQCFGAK